MSQSTSMCQTASVVQTSPKVQMVSTIQMTPLAQLASMMQTSSTSQIGGTSIAVTQLTSNVGGSVAVGGLTAADAIILEDSSDDSNGDGSIPKVINNELVSFSYCYLDGCMVMFILLDLHTSSHRLE